MTFDDDIAAHGFGPFAHSCQAAAAAEDRNGLIGKTLPGVRNFKAYLLGV